MGSRPKRQEYEASAAEKASASVALAEYKNFKKKYDPLLKEMKEASMTQDVSSTLRGRANADTMQALTSTPTYNLTQETNVPSEMSRALGGQLQVANVSAKDIQNKQRTNVLGTARGQAADAQSGMAQASRLATSDALARARAAQDVRSARSSALGQIAGATLVYGNENEMFGKKPNAGTVDADGNRTGQTDGSFGYNFIRNVFGY
jgi:hypothetical protein|tara:strand:- start:608 stop:1225 length:618 start_codon:yes stop_codon:yes gene_type:complete